VVPDPSKPDKGKTKTLGIAYTFDLLQISRTIHKADVFNPHMSDNFSLSKLESFDLTMKLIEIII
jgi:hypothetical protein